MQVSYNKPRMIVRFNNRSHRLFVHTTNLKNLIKTPRWSNSPEEPSRVQQNLCIPINPLIELVVRGGCLVEG